MPCPRLQKASDERFGFLVPAAPLSPITRATIGPNSPFAPGGASPPGKSSRPVLAGARLEGEAGEHGARLSAVLPRGGVGEPLGQGEILGERSARLRPAPHLR